MSISTLFIGYYHGLLLRDIDADLLINEMSSTGLLTGDTLPLIASGHTVHHRNWLLLEHVRHFELKLLLQFCKLVKEKWVETGAQFTTGMEYVYFIIYTSTSVLPTTKYSHCESTTWPVCFYTN